MSSELKQDLDENAPEREMLIAQLLFKNKPSAAAAGAIKTALEE